MFVWDIEEGRVKEQPIIIIPTAAVVPMPKLNVQNRLEYVLAIALISTSTW